MNHHENFSNYIKDKKVIIVGPSPSAFKNTKDFIESYDIICRIKKSFPIQKEQEPYIGSRTNILISHLKTTFRKNQYKQSNFNKYHAKLFNKNLDYILFPFPLHNQFNNFYKNYQKDFPNIKIPVIYENNLDNLKNTTENLDNYCPTTGLAGIISLLDYDIQELYITGISFQKDGFISSYKNINETKHCQERTKTIHNMDKEINYFKKLIEKDKRIKIDETLKEILDS